MVCQSYSARSYVVARSPTRVVYSLQENQAFNTTLGNLVSYVSACSGAQEQLLFMQAKQVTVDRAAMMKFANCLQIAAGLRNRAFRKKISSTSRLVMAICKCVMPVGLDIFQVFRNAEVVQELANVGRNRHSQLRRRCF